MRHIIAEWIPRMQAYRVWDYNRPLDVIAYADTADEVVEWCRKMSYKLTLLMVPVWFVRWTDYTGRLHELEFSSEEDARTEAEGLDAEWVEVSEIPLDTPAGTD